MKTTNTAPVPTTAADIEQRIHDERHRLLLEQNLQADLNKQRIAPLEVGDDEALDRIEAQINASCDRQARIGERIEILEQRLAEAKAREGEAVIDALAARAERARDIGEKLIRTEFRKQAQAMAAVLRKLWAIDNLIEGTNRQIASAAREPIPTSNDIRTRPMRRFVETVRKTVGPNQPEHPFFGMTTHSAAHCEMVTHRLTHACLPAYVEVDVQVERTEHGIYPDPLWKSIELPGIGPEELPLWNHDGQCIGVESGYADEMLTKREQLLAKTIDELGLDKETTP